jgi:threonyl-tRNA synthetase
MTPSLESIRQAAAELLAFTVRDIVPNTIMVQGEKTDIGFYYDFLLDQPVDKDAIPMIEERMRINIKKSIPLKSLEMMRENAAALFEYHGQAIQANRVLYAENNLLPIVQIDSFYDYCYPPYVPLSSDIPAFKILSITKERVNIPGSGLITVTRIAGTAAHDKDHLKKFIKRLEEAKLNDCRRLAEEKDLFLVGNPTIWLPKGMKIRETITSWWKKEHLAQGFSLVKASSHPDIFKHFNHSNKDLPVRYAEISESDTATTFCLKEQVSDEINKSLQFILKTSNILGFGSQWYLVAQNDRDKAIEPLIEGLKQSEIPFSTETYKTSGKKGPRIEVRWVDFLGREWLGPTLTIEYRDNIAIITRSVFSSLERCIALLVEHYAMTKENIGESFE